MKLVTVATSSEGYFPWLQQSCKRYGAKLDILGWGQPWKGFGWRFELMLDYLQKQSPEELVCFIDAYDVILLQPLEYLETKYLKMVQTYQKPIIVSTEKQKRYFSWLMGMYIFGSCQNQLLNAGVYMGKAKDLIEVIQYIQTNITDNPKSDDQISLSKYCKKNPEKIYLDKYSELFLTVCDIIPVQYNNQYIRIENNTLHYKNQTPVILHGNGNTRIENIIQELGYTITEEELEKVKQYHHRALIKKTPHYGKYVLPLIIIVLLIFWAIYKQTK